jgi:hypothetical protein
VSGAAPFAEHPRCMADFVEHLYNYRRNFERCLACDSAGDALDKRP